MKIFPDWRHRQLQSDTAKNPKSDRAEYLDPGLFFQVITRHNACFQDAYPNYRQTSSLLIKVSEARNTWAHSLTSDLLSDEVGLTLMAMEKLLSDAELPAANEVERLRNEVMGIAGPVPTAEPIEVPAPMATPKAGTSIPYWWEVCEPNAGSMPPLDGHGAGNSIGTVSDTGTQLSLVPPAPPIPPPARKAGEISAERPAPGCSQDQQPPALPIPLPHPRIV